MVNYYKPKHFPLQELVDPASFSALGNRAWQCLDPRLLWTLDAIRGLHKATIVNTWHNGGQFSLRGFRSPGCGVGAAYSQHRFGRAADMHFTERSVEEVRADIIQHPERPEYQYITAVELDVSWLHIDLRAHDRSRGLFLFNA